MHLSITDVLLKAVDTRAIHIINYIMTTAAAAAAAAG